MLLLNNVWIGKGNLSVDAPLDSRGNVEASRREFSNPDRLDYRPRKASRLVGQAGFRGADASNLMLPLREYTHPGFELPARKPHTADATDTRRVPDDRALVHDTLCRTATLNNPESPPRHDFLVGSTRMIRRAER